MQHIRNLIRAIVRGVVFVFYVLPHLIPAGGLLFCAAIVEPLKVNNHVKRAWFSTLLFLTIAAPLFFMGMSEHSSLRYGFLGMAGFSAAMAAIFFGLGIVLLRRSPQQIAS